MHCVSALARFHASLCRDFAAISGPTSRFRKSPAGASAFSEAFERSCQALCLTIPRWKIGSAGAKVWPPASATSPRCATATAPRVPPTPRAPPSVARAAAAALQAVGEMLKNLSTEQLISQITKPKRATLTVEDLIKEQNYKGFDRAGFDKLVAELAVQEPIEELLALANA